MEERLKKFVRLVEAGGFINASRELHISQPALSVAMAKLERELGASLLMHGIRPLTLTPAGRLAYNTGKELLVKAANLQVLLAELAHQHLAVSIGMIDSVAGLLFASAESIDQLERQASVSVVVDNSRNLLGATEQGRLDLAFVVDRRHYSSALEVLWRANEPLVMVCQVAQQVQVNQALQQGSLPRFISYDQASTSHQAIAAALQKHHITAEPVFYSTSPEVMLRLVLLQKGVAVLPYLLVRELLADGTLVQPTSSFFIERTITAVKRRDVTLATPLAQVSQRVSQLLDDLCASSLI